MMLRAAKYVESRWLSVSRVSLLLGFFLAGCGAVPISGPTESPLYGTRVKEQDVSSVAAVGKSREDVILNLGKPTIDLIDLRIFVYPWIEHKGDWLFFIFGATGGAAATTYKQEDWALLVAFDDKDHVTHAGLVKKRSSDSINTIAYDWLKSEGLDVSNRQSSFALSPIPKDKSLIYIFREKPPTSWKTMIGSGFSWPWPVAVAADDQYLSEMHDETYISLVVEPGEHELLADALPSYRYVERGTLVIPLSKRRPASITVDTLPNQAYFIQLLCTSSGLGWMDTSLTQQAEADAIPVLQQFRPVW